MDRGSIVRSSPRSMAELSQRAISTGHAGLTINQPLNILDPSSEAEIWREHVKNALECDDRHKTKRTSCDDCHFSARPVFQLLGIERMKSVRKRISARERRLLGGYCCKTLSTEKPRNIDSSPLPSRQESVAAFIVSILLLRFDACQIVF